MEEKFRKAIYKAYALNASIYQDGNPTENLVLKWKSAPSIESELKKLGEVEAYLAGKTLEEIMEMDVEDIDGKRILLGGMPSEEALASTNYEGMMNKILWEYPKSQHQRNVFLLAFRTSEMIGGLLTEAEKSALIRDAPSMLKGNKGSKTHEQEIYQMLRITLDDLSAISEPVSYGRLVFIRQYVPALLNKDNSKRPEIMRKILEREFPFVDEDKEEWSTNIREY